MNYRIIEYILLYRNKDIVIININYRNIKRIP